MKKITLLTALLICAFGIAQNTASGSADVNAILVKPLSLTVETGLDFGTFTKANGAEGTVTVAAGGGRTFSHASDMQIPGETASSPATFTVDLDTGEFYSLTLAVEEQPKLDGGTTEEMVLSDLTSTISADDNQSTSFGVGGKLTIPQTQTPGTYSGKIKVTVAYQ